MKILLSAYECEPNRGREQGRGWNWSLEVARLGHQVWILTPLRNQALIEPVRAEQSLPNLHFVYIEDSALIRHYFDNKKGTVLRYLIWQWRAYHTAQRLDQAHGFDLVHHVTMGSLTGGSWLWRLNKPFVFGPAGGGQVSPPAFKAYFSQDWPAEALRSFVVKHLMHQNPLSRATFEQTDLVLAANGDTVGLAQRLGAQQVVSFFDAGLPEDYFPPEVPTRSPAQELRLFWVARMFPRKALLLALEAVAQVGAAVPIRLTIAGGGEQEQHLPGWIEQLDLGHRVQSVGFLSWAAVKEQYLQSDVLLFTSLRDTGGAQLLEAMAQALPIIALDHQGAGDHIPDRAGIKVPVTTPTKTINALARAIEYMHENPAARLSMGQVGFEYAKTQTWPRKIRVASQYYEQLVHSHQLENAAASNPSC
ncbi:MAG: glycosyltransferase [Cyanothece sp. SIO1E1]|nr:glycosyltransferase [Cyanothece sp. SIO1E1]